jgi:hypothetical protein
MSKLTINLGELEKGNNQQKNKDFKKEGTNSVNPKRWTIK